MSNIQDEILQMTTVKQAASDPLTDTINVEKLSDRELKRLENGFQQKIYKIKEEKEKRQRVKRMNDSISRKSSDSINLKN